MKILILLFALATPAYGGARDCGMELQQTLGHAPNWTTMSTVSTALEGKDATLVAATLIVGAIESGLSAKAPRGAAGEVGMFQIMPANIPWLSKLCGVRGHPRDEAVNAQLAYCLISHLYQLTDGDLDATVAAYNAGPRIIPRVLRYQQLPPVTSSYLWRFNRLLRRVQACQF